MLKKEQVFSGFKQLSGLWVETGENKLGFYIETRRGSPVDRRISTAEAPPIGKVHPFSKIAVTLETVMRS